MLEPNPEITSILVTALNSVNSKLKSATDSRTAILLIRDKAIKDLAANDQTMAGLRTQKEAIVGHLPLVAPPLSDDEIAAIENEVQP